MQSNIFQNYYCVSNFCNCQEFYNLPASICCPPCGYCCCCPICRQRNKSKLTKMSLKPRTSNEAASASKNTSKLKSKTNKTKRLSKNGIQEEQTSRRESVSSQGGKQFKTDKPFNNSPHSLLSSNTSLKNVNPFCSSLFCGSRLRKSNSKQALNLNIPLSNNPEQKRPTTNSNGKNSLRHSLASNQSTRQQMKNLENMDQSLNIVRKSLSKKPQSLCSPKIQSTRKCHCCNKTLLKHSGSPNNISHHSISGTKSCSQLDVINEEDNDNENNRKQYNSTENITAYDNFHNEEPQYRRSHQSNSRRDEKREHPKSTVNKSKTLEDSCADFLSIVCDSIMESVQESVDSKLKEFGNQATEKFMGLRQKLDRNEAAMKYLIDDLAEKMLERNQRNFEDFYLRVQELVEKQNELKINETQNKETQSSEPVQEKENIADQPLNNTTERDKQSSLKPTQNEENNSNFSENLSHSANENEVNSLKSQRNEENLSNNSKYFANNTNEIPHQLLKQSEGNISNISEQSSHSALELEQNEDKISNISKKLSNNTNEICNSNESFIKCASCNCCFKAENFCHSCYPEETSDENSEHSNDRVRERGGCNNYEATQTNLDNGKMKLKKNFSLTQKSKSLKHSLSVQEFCLLQRSSLPPTTAVTKFSLTPTKTNSLTHSHHCDKINIKSFATEKKHNFSNKNCFLKFNSSIVHDNYDTSGYATEPEDSSESTVVNSGRKKSQKKSLKQHKLNCQNSITLESYNNNAAAAMYDVCERSSSQAIKRLSRSSLKSCGSSPTRLSRL